MSHTPGGSHVRSISTMISSHHPHHYNNNTTNSTKFHVNDRVHVDTTKQVQFKSRPTSGNHSPTEDGPNNQPSLFIRTLESDLDDSHSLELLKLFETSLFSEFDNEDLKLLSHVLTFLHFQSSEVIIQSGEKSSFVAILLEGVLLAKSPISNHSSKIIEPHKINPGALLGERSMFEGGTRTAEVIVDSTDGAVLAIITFQELEILKKYHPELRLKLITLFAVEGIKKLANSINENNNNKDINLSEPTTPKHNNLSGSEALFRLKLHNEKKKFEHKTKAIQLKRVEAEHKLNRETLIVDKHTREVQQKNETIYQYHCEIQQLKQSLKQTGLKLVQAEKLADIRFEERNKLQNEFDTEKQLQISLNETIKSLEFKLQEQQVVYVQQKYKITGEFQENIKSLENQIEYLQKDNKKLIGTIVELTNKVKNCEKQIKSHNEITVKVDNSHIELANKNMKLQQVLDQQKFELQTLKMKLVEQYELNQQLYTQSRAHIESIENLTSLLAQTQRDLTAKTQQYLQTQHFSKCYSKLLKITMIQRFVKEFQRKRSLLTMLNQYYGIAQNLHKSVINDQFIDTDRNTNNRINSVDNNNDVNDKNEINVIHSEIDRETMLTFPTSYSIHTKKNSTIKMESILAFYVELVPFLSNLVNESVHQKVYWKSMAESFFNRTIQLKQLLTESKITEPMNNSSYNTSKDIVSTHSSLVNDFCFHKLPGVVPLNNTTNSMKVNENKSSITSINSSSIPIDFSSKDSHLNYISSSKEPEKLFRCSVEITQLKQQLQKEHAITKKYQLDLNSLQEEFKLFKQSTQQLILLDPNSTNTNSNNTSSYISNNELNHFKYIEEQYKVLKKRLKQEKNANKLLNERVLDLLQQQGTIQFNHTINSKIFHNANINTNVSNSLINSNSVINEDNNFSLLKAKPPTEGTPGTAPLNFPQYNRLPLSESKELSSHSNIKYVTKLEDSVKEISSNLIGYQNGEKFQSQEVQHNIPNRPSTVNHISERIIPMQFPGPRVINNNQNGAGNSNSINSSHPVPVNFPQPLLHVFPHHQFQPQQSPQIKQFDPKSSQQQHLFQQLIDQYSPYAEGAIVITPRPPVHNNNHNHNSQTHHRNISVPLNSSKRTVRSPLIFPHIKLPL